MLIPAPDETKADAIGKAAQAFDGPLTFQGHIGYDDAYARGRALVVVPGIWSAMPAALLDAMRVRRRASATGRCPACDAVLELTTGQMPHESWCSASDDQLQPLVIRFERKVGTYARGRRIVEDPA